MGASAPVPFKRRPRGTRFDNGLSAAQVRAIRLAMGMRQVDLAFHLGCGSNTVSNWERGAQQIGRLAEFSLRSLAISHGIDLRRFAPVGSGGRRNDT